MATKKPLVIGSTSRPQEILDADGVDLSANSHFGVPSGAGGPTINSAGYVGVDTTSGTFNFYNGSVERALSPVRTASITIVDPDNTVDATIFRTNFALTISEIEVILLGTTPSVTWTLKHATDRSAVGTTIDSNTSTNSTTGDVHTVLSDSTVPADSFIWLEISATSGTVDEINVSFDFTYDP